MKPIARIECSAPGKVVLWGEYAVLAGAPALVLAVDRRAHCRVDVLRPSVRPVPERAPWEFSSKGFTGTAIGMTRSDFLGSTAPPADSAAWLAWHVAQGFRARQPDAFERLPANIDLLTDTRGFFESGIKLGVGSSAAVCVALYGAFCVLTGQPPAFRDVLGTHHRLQGNRGSGVDIAAAWHGGMMRFERSAADADTAPTVRPWTLPPTLSYQFVWTGHAASTPAHLERFAHWQAQGHITPLLALSEAARALFDAEPTLNALHHYAACLRALDAAATLGIYDPAHEELHQLAVRAGVVYKPCGAGGGDLGAAFGDDPARIQQFIAAAQNAGYAPLRLETAHHGIDIGR
ncbi:MAG: mevalonate kinase [Gammaproteobacteria bacterium]